MPKCNVCEEKYYYHSEVDPPEHCMCGMDFGYDLWADTGSWTEWWQLVVLRGRWRLSKAVWWFAELVTPK